MSNTQHVTAAEALAAAFPITAAVVPVLVPGRITPESESILSASFVGNPSADIAIALNDPSLVSGAGGTGIVALADVMRSSLEAAAGTIGAGVLGDVTLSGSDPVFTDAKASVFALNAGEKTIGYFAVRIRESFGLPAGITPLSVPSVDKHLSRINDVEMSLTVEIGRTRMPIREVLALEPGGVVELDRSAGAPADVLLNGRLIAHGEVVVVDQDYAVRITKILDVDGLS